ncbi:MAG: Zn-ribbon domain-containing OB-fold protein [Acidimicrobiales bacterium]|nr:Zn-ribbon domain-containing OB-fold protein [Acidimicrobiales bacterium]
MTTVAKPMPQPTAVSQPYWDAAGEHRLVAPRCRSCRTLFLYPRATCPACLSTDLDWEQLSGRGRVYTFTVVRQAAHPAFTEDVPYVLAIVELDEGPRLLTNVIGCDPAEVRCDQPVEVVFDDTGEVTVPKFQPVAG